MIRRGITGCLGALAALVAASTPAAQHPSESSHPAGPGAGIVLPQRVVAGQQATLAVLDAAGHLTPKTAVEFSGDERVTTDATGRATFLAPAEPGVLLARLPTMEYARLGGHTGGNLLLSMMQSYSGDFLDVIDGLRALLGCRGRVWPVTVEQASVCAEYGDGSVTRGEVEVDAAQSSGRFVRRIWLEPAVSIHPAVATAIAGFDAAIIGPGSFYTSLMPIFLVRGVAEALAEMHGPIILIANLLTEGRGMLGFTAADAVARIEEAAGRKVDVVIANMKWPSPHVLERYALEHKEPLSTGSLPEHCELIGGDFWTGDIARHDRLRLAYAVWTVLSRRLLSDS